MYMDASACHNTTMARLRSCTSWIAPKPGTARGSAAGRLVRSGAGARSGGGAGRRWLSCRCRGAGWSRRGYCSACPGSCCRLDGSQRFSACPRDRLGRPLTEVQHPPERQDEVGHLVHEPAENEKAQERDGERKAETNLNLSL